MVELLDIFLVDVKAEKWDENLVALLVVWMVVETVALTADVWAD